MGLVCLISDGLAVRLTEKLIMAWTSPAKGISSSNIQRLT